MTAGHQLGKFRTEFAAVELQKIRIPLPRHLGIILEIPEESGPFGAKGIGEVIVPPTAPAIANAVYDAIGVRVNSLPITPEKLVRHYAEPQ